MRFHFSLVLAFIAVISLIAYPAFAVENKEIETKIKTGIGVEQLMYKEHSSEHSLNSDADVLNLVLSVEGIKRLKNVFVGIQGIIPAKKIDGREEWFQNNNLTQTNSLKYSRTQLASFIGYPFNRIFNPLLGLRLIWSEQQRFDFRGQDGFPVSSYKITERVMAHYITLGFKGRKQLSKKWGLSYSAEYDFPFYSKVTNDGLPNWKETNIDGYLWSGYSELFYSAGDRLILGLLLSVGQQRWEGSSWQAYNGGQVQWPENDTYFINSFVSGTWVF